MHIWVLPYTPCPLILKNVPLVAVPMMMHFEPCTALSVSIELTHVVRQLNIPSTLASRACRIMANVYLSKKVKTHSRCH